MDCIGSESVYNLVEREVEKLERLPRYKSAFSGTQPPTSSTFNIPKKICGSFGPNKMTNTNANANSSETSNYLKASSKPVASLNRLKKSNPDVLKPSKCKDKFKPSLPGKEEVPVTGLVTKKNFIVANAVENILAAPKKRVEEESDFMNKDDFGKVPLYLSKIKEDINAEYEYIRAIKTQQQEANKTTYSLSQEDREQLIQALKAKWENTNSEYQLGTHLTKLDTVGKIKRKEKQEKELNEIEQGIEKLKRENIVIDTSS